MENLKELFNRTDKDGNRTFLDGVNLYLVLKAENRKRLIGQISRHPDGKLMYEKREKYTNLFKRLNAWGVHNFVVENVSYLKITTVVEGVTLIYKITTEKAKEVGKSSYLYFKKEGFELQLFIPLKEWWVGQIRN